MGGLGSGGMRARALLIPVALVLLVGCGGDPEQPVASPVVSETPVETTVETTMEVEPTAGIDTSGDFATDLDQVTGIEPDDVDDYRSYIAEGLCETDVDPDAVGPGAFRVMVERYGKDDPESGRHPDLVRLVIAYDCPDRAGLAEEYLEEMGQ